MAHFVWPEPRGRFFPYKQNLIPRSIHLHQKTFMLCFYYTCRFYHNNRRRQLRLSISTVLYYGVFRTYFQVWQAREARREAHKTPFVMARRPTPLYIWRGPSYDFGTFYLFFKPDLAIKRLPKWRKNLQRTRWTVGQETKDRNRARCCL